MFPLTVVEHQLPLFLVRLVATLVPTWLIIILPTATPEIRVSLWPMLGAIIGFTGWVLPCVLTCT